MNPDIQYLIYLFIWGGGGILIKIVEKLFKQILCHRKLTVNTEISLYLQYIDSWFRKFKSKIDTQQFYAVTNDATYRTIQIPSTHV